MIQQKHTGTFEKLLNWGVSAGLIFLAAAALTQFIPLVQLGVIPDLGSRTRYANLVRIPTILFAVFLIFLYWRLPEIFSRLSVTRIAKKIELRHARWIIVLLTLYYASKASVIGHFRHLALETRAFDLGIFAQAVWNTLHGDFLFSSLKENICLLGDHFSPILLLLTPFYFLWEDPRMLLVVQSFAMAACIPLLFSLARKVTGDHHFGLVIALCFFLFMPSRNVLREDFHPEVLSQPFMILAFSALLQGRYKLFGLSLLFILTGKESLAGIVFMFGAYLFAVEKRRLAGFALAFFSVVYLLTITKIVIPAISGEPYLYRGFYRHLAGNPINLFGYLFSAGTFEYLFKIFSPLLFLSFFHPSVMLTLPVLMQNLLSNNPVTRSFGYHYTVGLTPFIFISAIMGWKAIMNWRPSLRRHQGILMTCLILASLLRSGPSFSYYAWQIESNINEHTRRVRALIEEHVGREGSVLSHNNLLPQMINRKYVFQFEYNTLPTKRTQAAELKPAYIVMDRHFWEPNTLAFEEVLEGLTTLGYRTLHQSDDLTVLSKSLSAES